METMDTIHHVKHSWKNEMILPYCAIEDNIKMLCFDGEKHILTVDGKKALVEKWSDIHICEMESLVQRLYGIDSWTFCKKWFSSGSKFQSATFVYIKSKLIE